MSFCKLFAQAGPQTVILSISAFQLPRIAGMSHKHPVYKYMFIFSQRTVEYRFEIVGLNHVDV
jgi:hypothetical protein